MCIKYLWRDIKKKKTNLVIPVSSGKGELGKRFYTAPLLLDMKPGECVICAENEYRCICTKCKGPLLTFRRILWKRKHISVKFINPKREQLLFQQGPEGMTLSTGKF